MAGSKPSDKPIDYTGIGNPYDANMSREDPNPPIRKWPTPANAAVRNGEYLRDMIIDTFIQSRNFIDKRRGFRIEGDTGHAQFNDITLTGGVINFGKTSFDDTVDPGYFIGPQGIYFGTANDGTFLRYDISTGEFTVANLTLTGGTLKFGKESFSDAAHSGYFIGPEGIYFGAPNDTTYVKYDISASSLQVFGTISTGPGPDQRIVLYSANDPNVNNRNTMISYGADGLYTVAIGGSGFIDVRVPATSVSGFARPAVVVRNASNEPSFQAVVSGGGTASFLTVDDNSTGKRDGRGQYLSNLTANSVLPVQQLVQASGIGNTFFRMQVFEADPLFGMILGNSSTQFDITNPTGIEFKYTYNGTGTAPTFIGNLKVGTLVSTFAQNFNIHNKDTFTILAFDATSFTVSNALGVVESGKSIGTGQVATTKPLVSITLWLTRGVNPNGILNADNIGDVMFGAGGGKIYVATDTAGTWAIK